MSNPKATLENHPFPSKRPNITIKKSDMKPFTVDCPELRWWFGIPREGDQTVWAIYDSPEWKLSSVTKMETVREARIHEIEGVEISVNEWREPDTLGWKNNISTMYARLTPNSIQWLAVSRIIDGKRIYNTFLDEFFEEDWGAEEPRQFKDDGRFTSEQEGIYKQTASKNKSIGAGRFTVQIGDNIFDCLRVLDFDDGVSEQGILIESYLTTAGRTVLSRRYNGRLWGVKDKDKETAWDIRFPNHRKLIIDEVLYVHWYDCLTHTAMDVSL